MASSSTSHKGCACPRKAGFSLIELMIVIGMISTLAAIALPNHLKYRDTAKNARAMGDIRAMEKMIANFQLNNGRLPASLAEIGRGGRLDPWETPYQYTVVEGTPTGALRKDRFLVPVNSDYDLYSMGKDRGSASPFTARASQDDIVRANDGAYVGLASEF